MRPATVVVDGYQERQLTLGANQPEYQPLPALMCRDKQGTVITRWILGPEEVERLQKFPWIYISTLTFGNRYQPVMPSIERPDVPEPEPEQDPAGFGFTVEYRICVLDRETGRPVIGIHEAPTMICDMTAMRDVLRACHAIKEEDPIKALQAAISFHAEKLADLYVANIYFRPYGSGEDRWIEVSPKRPVSEDLEAQLRINENGKPAGPETISAFNERPEVSEISAVVDVAALDPDGSADRGTARAMTFGLRERFHPPFYLQGFSRRDAHDQIAWFGKEIQAVPYGGIVAALAAFQDLAKPTGPLCVLLESLEGSFLLDVGLWEKATSSDDE